MVSVSKTSAGLLVLFPMLILVPVGALYNNLVNSGLNPSQTLTCDQSTLICSNTVSAGCQAQPTQCSFSGNSVSFLSATSPFTFLFTGNIFGFFSSLNNQGSSPIHGAWDAMGGNNVFLGTANCVIDDVPGKGLTKWQFHTCTQSNTDTSNTTEANAATWTNWNTGLTGITKKTPFFQLIQNASFGFSCTWQFQLNYTSGGQNTGYTWYGCALFKTTGGFGAAVNPNWDLWVAVPRELGVLSGGYTGACNGGKCYHENIQAALILWEAPHCAATSGGNNQGVNAIFVNGPCNDFWHSLNAIVQTAGSNSLAFGLFSPIITFLLGLVLLFIGTGINIRVSGSVLGTGTTGAVGTNTQGTRLAQAIGIGLVIWTPLNSLFGGWVTSSVLPLGLDVIINFVLFASVGTGLWFLMFGSSSGGGVHA